MANSKTYAVMVLVSAVAAVVLGSENGRRTTYPKQDPGVTDDSGELLQ